MKNIIQRCAICIYLLLARFSFFRNFFMRLAIFQPPSVSYTIRHHYFFPGCPSLTIDLESETQSKNTEQLLKISHKKRISTSTKAQSISLIKEKLYIRQFPRFGQQQLINASQRIQSRIPTNQFKYPDKVFKLIDNNLITQFVDTYDGITLSSYILNTSLGNLIASVYVEVENCQQIILYSHGNSCDLGWMIDTYLEIALECHINIFSYDYSGYGQSTGVSTDFNALSDIQAAYNFLIEELSFSPENIIIYGYSIGSGPSTYLASKYLVGGLIVHSGLSSVLRVLDPNMKQTSFYDIFPNIEYIQRVFAPTFILHGGADQMISVVHAEQLAMRAQNLYSVWLVDNGGHGNLDKIWKDQYLERLKTFLCHCKQMKHKIWEISNQQQQRQYNHIYDKVTEQSFIETSFEL